MDGNVVDWDGREAVGDMDGLLEVLSQWARACERASKHFTTLFPDGLAKAFFDSGDVGCSLQGRTVQLLHLWVDPNNG